MSIVSSSLPQSGQKIFIFVAFFALFCACISPVEAAFRGAVTLICRIIFLDNRLDFLAEIAARHDPVVPCLSPRYVLHIEFIGREIIAVDGRSAVLNKHNQRVRNLLILLLNLIGFFSFGKVSGRGDDFVTL